MSELGDTHLNWTINVGVVILHAKEMQGNIKLLG